MPKTNINKQIKDAISSYLKQSALVQEKAVESCVDAISLIAHTLIECLKNDKKILIFGNGGSAADAQHFAAELVGKFKIERKGFCAIALTTNTSILTAIGNDYGFEDIFSRQIQALGKKGDVAIGISTSGNAKNVLRAIKEAQVLEMKTICFTGKQGGKLLKIADICLTAPSNSTPFIQQVHCSSIHSICEIVEKMLSLPSVPKLICERYF